MKTRWFDKVTKTPLQEYPRPQLVRKDWQNLNGIFNYAITGKTDKIPSKFDGEILVPFAVESDLSRVAKRVSKDDLLWYEKKFTLDPCFKGKRVRLNFDAVDWECRVYINGRMIGQHTGGYDPFSFDITDYLVDGENTLNLRVFDPTDQSSQPRGKQASKSHGFWYTSTTGIWQTVWLEPVNDVYIEKLKLLPDIDAGSINVKTILNGEADLHATVKKGDLIVFNGRISADENIPVDDAILWSPENPFLYDLTVRVLDKNNTEIDSVDSYFGMRKFSIGKDKAGLPRIMLNNEPYFQRGLLDQGYWVDGGLTPPTDEAMIYDIQTMKDLGFNMLRKHIKVEPARWYYHCDRLGMIVWQDMVSGVQNLPMILVGGLPNITVTNVSDNLYAWFGRKDKYFRDEFEDEMYRMIDNLYNYPCIGCWVPFNEAWGQFDAKRIGTEIKAYDPSRIVDHASGWHDQKGPDLKSVHRYVVPVTMPRLDGRPFVLSEFGGLSYKIDGHVYDDKKSFGYNINYTDPAKYTAAYKRMFEKQIIPLVKKGLCATVYTQVSDVEFEVNGLLTYDREILKIDADVAREINAQLKY
ncbi:MAG: glycoside hydrolase family 2 [Clostridia bacterium]|nr:glycoside hydrolase family 2 [Clostridia bacterium]